MGQPHAGASAAEGGLVDEIRLWVCPLALGEGRRLFDGAGVPRLTLVETETYDGVASLRYST